VIKSWVFNSLHILSDQIWRTHPQKLKHSVFDNVSILCSWNNFVINLKYLYNLFVSLITCIFLNEMYIRISFLLKHFLVIPKYIYIYIYIEREREREFRFYIFLCFMLFRFLAGSAIIAKRLYASSLQERHLQYDA
jgi:hypothetical protein